MYSVYKCTPDELRSSVSLALPVLHGAVQIQGGCGARDVNLLIGILSETNFAKLSLRTPELSRVEEELHKIQGFKDLSPHSGPKKLVK